ncbi:MAG: class I SAM-dependent methyltransferase [Bacteroidetes bacterium]|nr:class I SAM-dependent methyltransferase [Bacteroidota bacterium]
MAAILMNTFTKEFWEDRVKRFGHTGHSEPFWYCFDQEARKYAIDTVLQENNLGNKKSALDFGCGSGDLSGIVNKYAGQVLGYDLSERVVEVAKEKYKGNTAIQFTASIEDIKRKGPYDLIAIIGVLQTFTKEQLTNTVQFLAENLASGGHMVCIEFFHTAELDWQDGSKATKNDWLTILENQKLIITKIYSFYNPHLYPSKSWRKYKRSPFLNLLKPFKSSLAVQRILSTSARQIIKKEQDVLQPENDIFKIYVLHKQ